MLKEIESQSHVDTPIQLPCAGKNKRTREVLPARRIIRELGLKVTEQRVQILELVRSGPAHFTAQELFERVNASNPGLGFATVYRFLRTLSDHSYVTEIRMGGSPARYEWAAKVHHDHLTCTRCRRIVEFENAAIEKLQNEVAQSFGFILNGHVLELYGTCPQCQLSNP